MASQAVALCFVPLGRITLPFYAKSVTHVRLHTSTLRTHTPLSASGSPHTFLIFPLKLRRIPSDTLPMLASLLCLSACRVACRVCVCMDASATNYKYVPPHTYLF